MRWTFKFDNTWNRRKINDIEYCLLDCMFKGLGNIIVGRVDHRTRNDRYDIISPHLRNLELP